VASESIRIYNEAVRLAQKLQQVSGEKSDYFVTLAQLEDILHNAPSEGEPPAANSQSSVLASVDDRCPDCNSPARNILNQRCRVGWPHPWHKSSPAAPRMGKAETADWMTQAAYRICAKLPNPENELGRVQAIATIIAETARRHEEHDRCRKNCKFCSLPCRCVCHTEDRAEPVVAARISQETLSYRTEATILAALMESLIKQKCPDFVSGYDIMDAIRPFLPRENSSTGAAPATAETQTKEVMPNAGRIPATTNTDEPGAAHPNTTQETPQQAWERGRTEAATVSDKFGGIYIAK